MPETVEATRSSSPDPWAKARAWQACWQAIQDKRDRQFAEETWGDDPAAPLPTPELWRLLTELPSETAASDAQVSPTGPLEWRLYAPVYGAREVDALDFGNMTEKLRIFAKEKGRDLDEMLEAASRHFTHDRPSPRQTPLSADEIRQLRQDDERALDG